MVAVSTRAAQIYICSLCPSPYFCMFPCIFKVVMSEGKPGMKYIYFTKYLCQSKVTVDILPIPEFIACFFGKIMKVLSFVWVQNRVD